MSPETELGDTRPEAASPPHVHDWQPVGIVAEDEWSYSPVSVLDHSARTNQFAVTSCSCGFIQRKLVAYGPWRWVNR